MPEIVGESWVYQEDKPMGVLLLLTLLAAPPRLPQLHHCESLVINYNVEETGVTQDVGYSFGPETTHLFSVPTSELPWKHDGYWYWRLDRLNLFRAPYLIEEVWLIKPGLETRRVGHRAHWVIPNITVEYSP